MNNIVENFQENFFIHASISFVYKSFYKQKTKKKNKKTKKKHLFSWKFEPTFSNSLTGILEKYINTIKVCLICKLPNILRPCLLNLDWMITWCSPKK